ncbi:MAG: bacteriorhodopsin [Silanimonas sp.]
MDELALVTQYTFIVTMLGMAAASVYFWLERDTLAVEFRGAATIAGIYTGIAAFMYSRMVGIVGDDGSAESVLALPTHFRYVDWVITTPLMLVNLLILLQVTSDKIGVVVVMILADIAMIAFGFFGERYSNIPGMEFEAWVLFGLGCLAYLMLLFMMYSVLTEAARDKVAPVRIAFERMRLFFLIGWSIYPLGFIVGMMSDAESFKIARELVYNFADLINKVGLGLVALVAAKQISREAAIRQAMRAL